jgi:uncharacterized protein (DUF1330 family)
MNRLLTPGLALLAGVAIGAVAVSGLHAQGTSPGAYFIVDISAVTNPDLFKTLLPKAGPAMAPFGGKYVMRTENITGLHGPPPKRFVVIAFENMDKAKAFYASAAQQEVNAIVDKSADTRRFLVDGLVQ